MKTKRIIATKWRGGWELSDEHTGEVLTQVKKIKNAKQQIVDYLDTVDPKVEHSAWNIEVQPYVDNASAYVQLAKSATKEMFLSQQKAANANREAVARLLAAGVNKSEIAQILNVSKTRVSQLANKSVKTQ